MAGSRPSFCSPPSSPMCHEGFRSACVTCPSSHARSTLLCPPLLKRKTDLSRRSFRKWEGAEKRGTIRAERRTDVSAVYSADGSCCSDLAWSRLSPLPLSPIDERHVKRVGSTEEEEDGRWLPVSPSVCVCVCIAEEQQSQSQRRTHTHTHSV